MINWNEIKARAITFSKDWEDVVSEEAEAKSFLDAFFQVFGISRRKFANFEFKVKKLNDKDGYIDLLWKGHILVEMKSRGQNLDKAFLQAKDYALSLGDKELPRYILVCDFHEFRLYNTDDFSSNTFLLADLNQNVNLFGYLIGREIKVYKEQDPVNIKAAELMGKLHDRLEEIGYTGHKLEVFLVRTLFCLFAEDTQIFSKQQFQDYIEQRTNIDGSDLAAKIQEIFQVLNTPTDERMTTLDEDLTAFPYVNGHLFNEIIPTASFDSKMRIALLECCYLDWSKISPAIFGSMFQSAMNPKERRNLGAHYTSEQNILKVIEPLFLNELRTEFDKLKSNKPKLKDFHDKLSRLKFFDPACGCGNFLIVTYRELRLLEIEVLKKIYSSGERFISIHDILKIDVDVVYGIEYEEFPAKIAEVAMWLMDHLMNRQVELAFGQYVSRLPLKKSANIIYGNALKIDWNKIIEHPMNLIVDAKVDYASEPIATYGKSTHSNLQKVKFNYILGNPPFIGSRIMNAEQKKDLIAVFDNSKNSGELDYVAGWYILAAKYMQNTDVKCAFVSTNSIVQGQHTSILWGNLMQNYGIKIHFAHRTFKWSNEAKGNAAVYCIIVGFYFEQNASIELGLNQVIKEIYDYENIKGDAHKIIAKNINPYLIDAKNIFIDKRSKPLCNVPEMNFGNMPADGGHYLFTDKEKNDFLAKEPLAEKYFKAFISAREFLHNEKRWCLWLEDFIPQEIHQLKLVKERISLVQKLREKSSRPYLANIPTLFAQITQPKGKDFLLIPSTTSENRKYMTLGLFKSTNISSNSCHIIPDGNLFQFGILSSKMHMSWVKVVCGRLKSDYRYSKDIVYNNFPWPESPTEKQLKLIKEKAQKVLDTRAKYPDSSLASLYDALTMPPDMVRAHAELDKAVDSAYRATPFSTDASRMEYLFDLYEKYSADLFTKLKVKKTRAKT
jgi:hypothetical protein